MPYNFMDGKKQLKCGCIVLNNDETFVVKPCLNPLHIAKRKTTESIKYCKRNKQGINCRVARGSFLNVK